LVSASTKTRSKRLAGILLGSAALVAAMAAAPALAQSSSPAAAGVAKQHGLGHVFIIMEENHARDHVIGDPNMPFTTKLAQRYGQATKYYGVTHTSEPNYIASTSGSNWDVNNDNGWNPTSSSSATNHYNHTNIVDELTRHHISWDAYMEAMPHAGYRGDVWPSSSDPLYASKHDPFMLYNDVRKNAARRAHVRPYRRLAHDLNSKNAPRYVWISPDQCNDMHGGVYDAIKGHPETPCPYNDTPGDANDEALKAKADAFLRKTVQTIKSSKAWTRNSVIFVTADETDYDGSNPDDNYYLSAKGCCDSPVLPAGDPAVSSSWPGGVYGGGKVPMIVVTSHGARHVTDKRAMNHYSMLLTIEEGFGLRKLGFTSDARQVKPMWPLVHPGSSR
jgi:hypothetical protein